jgi:hypothetical protein
MKVLDSIKRLFKKPQPEISETQAILIAQEECSRRNWPWLEPIHVASNKNTWLVHTNYESRGANARVVIDKTTGNVLKAMFAPR